MKKNIRMIGGIIALALLLVGTAFVGGRLLNRQGFVPAPLDGRWQPAAELPHKEADVSGVFDHRQDKSIFIVTGKRNEGPTVEVVVTTATSIYVDVSEREISHLPQGQRLLQQVVEPGSLDEIGEGSIITIWGRKTGDRYIADVLVYTPPEIRTK